MLPSAQAPTLLSSRRNPLNAPAIIAASAIFPPVADIRTRAAKEATAEATAVVQARRAAVFIPGAAAAIATEDVASAKLAKELGGAAVRTSDAATANILSDISSIHALSVAYGTAAGNIFEFPLRLADARHAKSGGNPLLSPSFLLESNLCSFDVPSPVPRRPAGTAAFVQASQAAASARDSSSAADSSALADPAADTVSLLRAASGQSLANLLGAPLPTTFVSGVTGLDLQGCVRLVPQSLPIVLRFCPHLTVLRLAGCNQFSTSVLVAACPSLTRLRLLDLDYVTTVDDDVLAAIGRHCPSLLRLQLVGCNLVTDAGVGEFGLLNQCSRLKRINLRGAHKITDAGVRSISMRCPQLEELCLSGISSLTAIAIAQLIVRCRRLRMLKAELWFDLPAVPGEPDDADGARRQYRLLSTVRGAIRYIRSILPPGDPLNELLAQRYREPHVPAGYAAAGAGAPLPVPIHGATEGAEVWSPSLARRSEIDDNMSVASSQPDIGTIATIDSLIGDALGPGSRGEANAAALAISAAAAATAAATAAAASSSSGR